MKTTLAAALAVAALAAAALPAAAAPVDFDRGIDVKAALKAAAAQPAPAPVQAQWTQHKGWMGDCKDVTVAAGRTLSEKLPLTSVELTEDCDFQPQGGMRCFPGFGMTVRKTAQLLFAQPTPASEDFRVCLEGADLYVEYMSARYAQKARPDGTIVLTPEP